MKLRKIRVQNFEHTDPFGKIVVRDAEVLIDPSINDVSAESFNQKKHTFFLSSSEIERLSRVSAHHFYDENIKSILNDKKTLTSDEIEGIKNFLQVNGSELGDLIGLNKSNISRLLSGKLTPQKDKMIILMGKIKEELEHPGKARITLQALSKKTSRKRNIEELNIPATQIAEYFIRKFVNTEGPLSHLKLQKLLYYSQGVGFGREDVKLMREKLCAWDHGPVIREIYDIYHGNESKPLPTNSSISLDQIEDNELVINILEETISLYGVYDAWYLREKTHNEKPWASTPKNKTISDEVMISYFKSILV